MIVLKKKKVIFQLEKELEKAKNRQHQNTREDSGQMRGLRKAIEIVKNS